MRDKELKEKDVLLKIQTQMSELAKIILYQPYLYKISTTHQISAKRGLASKFESEANTKFLLPKSKQSSIVISQIRVSMNPNYYPCFALVFNPE